jgi:hypothetical protein
MRAPESRIKEAILHPENEIRTSAVKYFAGQPGHDQSVMPLVIEAVEKYSRDEAFSILRAADELPQTEAAVRWLTGELSADWDLEEVWQDNYCMAVALVLCQADPGLLEAGFGELPCFPEEIRPWLDERIEMASWDWETGWAALEDLCKEARQRDTFVRADLRRGMRIIESLARHPAGADAVLPRLHARRSGRYSELGNWMEGFVIELAGKMRIEAAAPILVERLHEDDWDVSDSCIKALEDINGDRVVEIIAGQWHRGHSGFRLSAANVLEAIHTDLKVRKCLEFLAAEEDAEVANFLANSLLASFAEEAVEPVRALVEGEWDDLSPDDQDLRCRLVIAATVLGVTLPEYGAWFDYAVETNWGWGDFEPARMRVNFSREAEEEWDEDFDEDESDDEWEDEYDELPHVAKYEEGEVYAPPGVLKPFRREHPPIGRNDPCPCGSGKKYKKCCLKKEKDEPLL